MSDTAVPLTLSPARRWWRRRVTWFALAMCVVAATALVLWREHSAELARPRYDTQAVTRGHLVVTVTATGTVVPTNKVDIGSELSGTVARVNVDFNDRVKKDQVLAELDTDKLRDQVRRSEAALQVARAKVTQAQATVGETDGNLQRLRDVARLSGGRVPSRAELATAEAALTRARADAASAAAGVHDAQAALSADQTNLRKASIRSPINGVVLARSVDPGNAVAASLQAVTLFTVAEDLAQMKLQVNVDEADVGQVSPGQPASFTVSAYPARNYPARTTRVYEGSTIKDNVVTYVCELQVDNKDLTLRPGMTATAVIVTAERRDVLLVPNVALRFTPESADVPEPSAGLVSRLVPRMPARSRHATELPAGTLRRLWVLENGQAVPVDVTAGASDGKLTEVSGGGIPPGAAVITAQSVRKAG